MIQFIKKYFEKLSTTPKHVFYVNVGNMTPEEIDPYMSKLSKNLKLRKTLYIPTRTRETEFVNL
jgi:menaquinone-dependent protoporphyrinogen IX oxidase